MYERQKPEMEGKKYKTNNQLVVTLIKMESSGKKCGVFSVYLSLSDR